MKCRKYLIIISFLFFLMNSNAYSQIFSFEDDYNTGTAVFPAGTMFKAVAQETISSKANNVGDNISFVVLSDVTVGKSVCVPKDSVFLGKIVQLVHAKPGRDGYFQIAFDKLIFSDGWQAPVNARIWTKDGTGVIGGGITIRDQYKKVPHYIEDIGPVVQLVKTGPRKMGQERAFLAGNESVIVLENELEVKYLETLD